MYKYTIKSCQEGVEADHARIGIQVAREWLWPYAYDEEDLKQIHAQPDFDPETRLYCYLGGEMVGCSFWTRIPPAQGETPTATIDFPRMLPDHEAAAEQLLERMLVTIKKKGIDRVVGRVTTMAPGDIRLAEDAGFTISDWGYKVYYAYNLSRGELAVSDEGAEAIDSDKDLEAAARIASLWYKRPPDWCLSRIQEMLAYGMISHLGVRAGGRLIAASLAGPNFLRASTAANYYIFTPDENCLKPLLAKAIADCLKAGVRDFISDLINEHLQFEPVYQALGFRKAAEWARCEKAL